MSQHDKKIFQCDVDEIAWWDYFRKKFKRQTLRKITNPCHVLSLFFIGVYCYGLRRFICNEGADTLEAARRRYRLNVFILFNDFTRAISPLQTNDNFALPTHVVDLRLPRPPRLPNPQLLRPRRRRNRFHLTHQSHFRQDEDVMEDEINSALHHIKIKIKL